LTPALAAALHGSAQAASDELARVGDEIATLKSAVAEVKKDVSAVESLVKLPPAQDTGAVAAAIDAAVAPLKSEVKDLVTGLAVTNSEVEMLKSSTHILYSSIDQTTAAHLRDIDAINRRIGKVEDVISLRADVTAAIPTRSLAPLPKRRPPRMVGWIAEEIAPGLYLLKGPDVTYQVRDGSVIPGIGRIGLQRLADGKLRILTGKDAVRR
jgi:archaellum component FlaC